MTWQWRQAVANLAAAEAANRKAQARFDLAMEAVRAFTTGASEDVILKEKALEGLRKKLLGQSQSFYEKLRDSLEGETDRASRSALAEALFDAASLYAKVDAPQKAMEAHRQSLALRAALVREQPGDTAARRDLGRSHLASGSSCSCPWSQVDEAQAELGRARGVLEPLARERPDDGGARRLEAECDSLEGERLCAQRSGPPRGAGVPGAGQGPLRGPDPGQPRLHPADRGRRPDGIPPGPRDSPPRLGWIVLDEGRARRSPEDHGGAAGSLERWRPDRSPTDTDRRDSAAAIARSAGHLGFFRPLAPRRRGPIERGVAICPAARRREPHGDRYRVDDRLLA